ncbi:MAG: DUF2948 family protein [Jhaorihella sp.]
MTGDATFEDGRESPLNLGARDAEDLKVVSALVQDAVFAITEMTWRAADRRFVVLLNRFRWEDGARGRHGPERVRALLVVDNALRAASQGIDRSDRDVVLSVLALSFEPDGEGGGQILLTLAGNGAIRLDVEALEVTIKDVTRPYRAPSGQAPAHPE